MWLRDLRVKKLHMQRLAQKSKESIYPSGTFLKPFFFKCNSVSICLLLDSQNLVMFLSLVVAWVIPDVPKTIVEQLKREKKLLVDVFLQEEKEKFQLIRSLFSKDPTLQVSNLGQGPFVPGRYSTLPPGPTQGSYKGGDGPRARCRAASFSQFTRNNPTPPRNENSRHTAV